MAEEVHDRLVVYEEIDELLKHQGENSSFYSARDTGEMRYLSDVLGYVPEIRCSVQYGMGGHFYSFLKTEPAGEYVIRFVAMSSGVNGSGTFRKPCK